MKKIFILADILFISFSLLFCLTGTNSALAGNNLTNAFGINNGNNTDPLDAASDKAGYDTTNKDYLSPVSILIKTGLSFLGVIFLILIIYAGFIWMTDQGNEENVAKAKKILTGAIIGLIIVVSAYAISYFVTNALTNASAKTQK